MRKAVLVLAFIAPAACGGRTLGDWRDSASGGSSTGSGGASGGFAPRAGTGGVSVATGGQSGSGGLVGQGGVFATGGFATGGLATGGFATGGFATGGLGSGGREPCFEVTQPSDGICIHVRLCTAAQYETLCLLDTPTSAVCFCYIDGVATSATSVLSASYETLCEPAVGTRCP